MAINPLVAAGTASRVFSLSKRTWKLGTALSKLEQNASFAESDIAVLTEDVKTLGVECDLLYTELDEIANEKDAKSRHLSDINEGAWRCLEHQSEEIGRTTHDLGIFIQVLRSEDLRYYIDNLQRQTKIDERKNQIHWFSSRVCRHTDNFRTLLLVLNISLNPAAPGQLDRRIQELEDTIQQLHMHSQTATSAHTAQVEAELMRYAHELIEKSRLKLAAEPFTKGSQRAMETTLSVAEWVSIVQSMSGDAHNIARPRAGAGSESDDDLDTDLAKAALSTGASAFDSRDWAEADSLLKEALRGLQQLSENQRCFCDFFDLHYKLAVCSKYTQDPVEAEVALLSLIKLTPSIDEQRTHIDDATHLLSQVYISMGHLDRARYECEKALQSRRRLQGKRSTAALESTALMAHIYVMYDQRARAKSYLAMIPDERRETILKSVEASIGADVKHLDYASLLDTAAPPIPDQPTQHHNTRLSGSTLGTPPESHHFRPRSVMAATPTPSIREVHQRSPPDPAAVERPRYAAPKTLSPQLDIADTRIVEEDISTGTPAMDALSRLSLDEVPQEHPGLHSMSRKEILDRIGCQPRDQIEEAVCNGDFLALANLLNKKKSTWRSRLRKHVRPERLTALHFAALFGEVEMARQLVGSKFSVNDVPWGYTTRLPPLKVAIGARQVEMVDFLIVSGARPSEPDSWSDFAAQLMSRSWLTKTMSENERELVPGQIIAIMTSLFRQGWNVNEPYEPGGDTVLHQAVSFWTGSYRWDLTLRTAITSFLCQHGADPFQTNSEGKTAYGITEASGHQELLAILTAASHEVKLALRPAEPVELGG